MYKRVGTVAGIICVILIVVMNKPGEIAINLLRANIMVIFYAIILQSIIILISSLKLKVLTGKSLKTVFYVYLLGHATNLMTPVLKIGGEPVKVYMLKKRGLKTTEASAAVSLDTITELLVLYFLVVILGVYVFYIGVMPGIIFSFVLTVAIISVFIMCGVFVILFQHRVLRKVIDFFVKIVKKFRKINLGQEDYAKTFLLYFNLMTKKKKLLLSLTVISIIPKFLEFLRMWLIFYSIGQVIRIETIFAVWVFIMVLGMIPWLPGGLGLIEGGAITFFVMIGITSGVAGAGVLLDRFVSYWFVLLFAGSLLFRKRWLDVVNIGNRKNC